MTKLAYKNVKTTIINMVKKVMESISIMRGEIEKKKRTEWNFYSEY